MGRGGIAPVVPGAVPMPAALVVAAATAGLVISTRARAAAHVTPAAATRAEAVEPTVRPTGRTVGPDPAVRDCPAT